MVTFGPVSSSRSTNASSTSMRTLEYWSWRITEPFSYTWSAKIAP